MLSISSSKKRVGALHLARRSKRARARTHVSLALRLHTPALEPGRKRERSRSVVYITLRGSTTRGAITVYTGAHSHTPPWEGEERGLKKIKRQEERAPPPHNILPLPSLVWKAREQHLFGRSSGGTRSCTPPPLLGGSSTGTTEKGTPPPSRPLAFSFLCFAHLPSLSLCLFLAFSYVCTCCRCSVQKKSSQNGSRFLGTPLILPFCFVIEKKIIMKKKTEKPMT